MNLTTNQQRSRSDAANVLTFRDPSRRLMQIQDARPNSVLTE
jgi:hypothetical protein